MSILASSKLAFCPNQSAFLFPAQNGVRQADDGEAKAPFGALTKHTQSRFSLKSGATEPPSSSSSRIADPDRKTNTVEGELVNSIQESVDPDQSESPEGEDRVSALLEARFEGCVSDDLRIEHCKRILDCLLNPSLEGVVIRNVTVSEHAAVIQLIAEEKIEVKGKLTYFPDTRELFVMCPYPIHERPIAHLCASLHHFIHGIEHDQTLVEVQVLTNHRIHSDDITAIPDLQVVTIPYPLNSVGQPETLWVGEVGFAQHKNAMVRKLKMVLKETPSIGLILLVVIRETEKWSSPSENSSTAIALRKKPKMSFREFCPSRREIGIFGPVVVEGFSWLNVEVIEYHVFKRGQHDNAPIDLETTDPANTASGTLYPTRDMTRVEHLLREGAQSIKSAIIRHLEDLKVDQAEVDNVHASHPELELNWDRIQTHMSNAIYSTAHFRYADWYDRKFIKRKKVDNVQGSSMAPDALVGGAEIVRAQVKKLRLEAATNPAE
ncbi:hypothetical protein SERLA73DRAFT_176667 [Serpula lacrymans var. lacrymans S7.3]|uniref:Uncharacterized protein n=1 Tax=Serpula lacrymans var. lacrymans (strain S7.3) TaxID=936435 RepID=F8PPI5_SERL3|nr:hypothetical protein SERLA73DRAFT_176667 [Serpula lacrymans var. lacrymans S7.3]